MKFSDIEQVISDGEWECNFSIVSLVKTIEKMVEEEGLQLNPDFQRGHVWTEKQQISYVEMLLKGGCKNSRTIYLNNPSWKKPVKEGEYNDFVCVDGLQRVTAISNFVNNKIKVFGHYYDEYEDKVKFRRMLAGMKLNVNDLKTKAEVLEWYIQTNDGGTPHTREEIDRVKNMLKEELKR